MKKTLAGSGLEEDHLTDEELAAVDELKRTKYDTWEWNFGRSPKYNLRNKRRWDGGTLEPCVEVDQGIIRQIVFYGDFLAVSPMDEVTGALMGTPFRREDVGAVLDRFPLRDYFGTITPENERGTIFYVD